MALLEPSLIIEKQAKKGQNIRKQVQVSQQKGSNWAYEIQGLQPNQKGKMVQNAGIILKNRQNKRQTK